MAVINDKQEGDRQSWADLLKVPHLPTLVQKGSAWISGGWGPPRGRRSSLGRKFPRVALGRGLPAESLKRWSCSHENASPRQRWETDPASPTANTRVVA